MREEAGERVREGIGSGEVASASARPPMGTGRERCDACGEPMQPMGHCKWLCRCCGFLRTCIDTV